MCTILHKSQHNYFIFASIAFLKLSITPVLLEIPTSIPGARSFVEVLEDA